MVGTQVMQSKDHKLKYGDRVVCIKDDLDGPFLGKIGYLFKPTSPNGMWEFRFEVENSNAHTHYDGDCFMLCTPLVEAIYGE